ncbi:MAG: WD40-repeat-containing domain protein [Benniella sp.]|nr:MAG: WD40-repeat-containing domain protein [Benniella sp.]
MVFGSIISSPRGSLSLQKVIELANIYLESARGTADPNLALVLCHDTEVSLSHVKRAAKHTDDKAMRNGIATVYIGLGELLEIKGHQDEAQAFYKKSEKWGGSAHLSGRLKDSPRPSSLVLHSVHSTKGELPTTVDTTADKPLQQIPSCASVSRTKQETDIATISRTIFPSNVRPPTIVFVPPEPDSRLNDTLQLATCLGLLQDSYQPDDILDPIVRNWLLLTIKEQDERDRLKALATDVIRAFKRDEFKDAKSVTEVVRLAPVLESSDFRYLLKEFYSGIDQSGLLDVHQLEGLAHLIQGANPGYLDSDDLVKVLSLLSTRLRDTHQQSTSHLYQLTVAVSRVLDAMADTSVKGVDREKIHEPLILYLEELKGSSDPYLVYQAAYAYQALLCVPDDESLWQATLRRGGKVMQGVSGLVRAVKGLDMYGFIEGLGKIQEGLAGASEIVQTVKIAYDGLTSLAQDGRGFLSCLKEGLSFNRKCAWYTALRGADELIRDGQLADFRKLVCEAPCRRDAAFQWGVCQRLGQIAANSMWDTETRQSAIAFLGDMYRDDTVWGDQMNVKQWIVNILMQLSTLPGSEMQFPAKTQLQELRMNGDSAKRTLYQTCCDNGHGSHPLKAMLSQIGSPSLLDRVQERPDVEGTLRQLRRQRLKEREKIVYIHPQAKAGLQARDDARFPLMENVSDFLESDRQVFLLLGDSGAGKSTFNRELECHLWEAYKKNGTIPLHVNLPAIDKPEYDMIAKQLRKAEFNEPQIRELKLHRKFVLICDGYDESQQTHNLYTCNRLNQPGEWDAKMIISCRSEYLGADYRDRFQPGDRNQHSGQSLLQEAVITPFSMAQVKAYITQYVSMYRPLWEANEYKKALDLIPSLNELVKNPFLMSLSLEVLPRMVDPGQDMSVTHITRMALYDQFIEHWLERGKKRVGEKNLSPQARAAFESLIDEGFTRNGVDYLKRLSVAIYREQDGQPIVTYSRYKDENTWKGEFFSREEENQLLREASPLTRNGNQHRFIHRSLLEYGVALAIFDPQEVKEKKESVPPLDRRMNASSLMSFDGRDPEQKSAAAVEQEPSPNSPLAWRCFLSDPSVLQFLEERVQQEPLFKELLLSYIEQSKVNRKWCTAASNSITILVRAGVQFIEADLRGIQIPNADLSYGMFDSAQFQGADLRQIDLRGAWLRNADLSDVQMTSVQFGELPFLEYDSAVMICVYSPDGKTMTAGLYSGEIIVHSTSNWECLWILEGHTEPTNSLVYSPDSKRIASSSYDRTLRLWDALTGVCTHVLNGYYEHFGIVAYSPRGDQFSSASYSKTVKVWSVETGDCLHILIGHTGIVRGVVYSPNGNQIASNGDDGTVRIWGIDDAETRVHVLRGHESGVNDIAYSPQGDQIASSSWDKTIRLWDVATRDCCHILTDHTGPVYSVTYSPSGGQVATSSSDNSVRLWDAKTGVCLHALLGHTGYVSSVVFSPQGNLVASASEDKTVRVWDVETGVCRQTLTGHSEYVASIVFSLKGDHIASSSHDKTIRLWDVGVGTSRFIPNGHTDSVEEVKLSPSGDNVATCSCDNTVRIWDVETGTCRQTLRGHDYAVMSVAYSPQGNQIATCSHDFTVRLWNTETGEYSHILIGHSNNVNSVVYSPRGDLLASASNDRTVRIWDVESGECRHILSGHTDNVLEVVYSPNGNQSASCGWDPTIRIWDTETGTCNHTLSGHNDLVTNLAYSPQGDQVVSSSEDSTVRVWDVETGECLHILIGHIEGVSSVSYSPSGNQIASGSSDGSLKLWDLEARACPQTLVGHSERVNRILYSPLGDMVVTASDDKSVLFWDVTSGQCRAVIQGFQDRVRDIVWIEASSVNYLITGCSDGTVGRWKVEMNEDPCPVTLQWSTMTGALNVNDASIQDVRGLSQLNRQLLAQRGAAGEPVHHLREASKKLVTMASAVSKLQTPSDKTKEDPASTTSVSMDQLEQWLEQGKGILDQDVVDVVASIVKVIHKHK